MNKKRTFHVATIGFPEYELRILKSIFSLTVNRTRTYVIVDSTAHQSADIVMVNGDAPTALPYGASARAINPAVPVVTVMKAPPSDLPQYLIRRPFIASQVLITLDKVTIKTLRFTPELIIGQELNGPGIPSQVYEVLEKPQSTSERYKALVVDDNPTVRRQVEIELRLLSIEADFADSGSKALELLRTNTYDIIFLDVILPDVNGYRISKAVRKNSVMKQTPIIMLTGKESPLDRLRGKISGCNAYLTKPVQRETFQATVSDCLAIAPEKQRPPPDESNRTPADQAGRGDGNANRQYSSAVINNVEALVLVLDREGRIVRFNPACERLSGYSFDEVKGKFFWDLFLAPEERQAKLADFQKLLAGPFPSRHENGWLTKDKRHRRIEWTSTTITNQEGVIEYIILTGIDVTERSEVEETLRAHKKRFKDFAETAADWFWEMDAELRFSYLSEPFEAIKGISRDQILGRTHKQFFTAQAVRAEHLESLLADLAAQRAFEDFVYSWVCPDQTVRVLRISGKPIFDVKGPFQGYRGVGSDVTESHQIIQELTHQASHDPLTGLVNRQEFERRLQRVLESARTGPSEHALCYLDLDRFKNVNDTCGHAAGDELLRQLSKLFQKHIRQRDTLARLGGDEFGVLLEHCSLEPARRIASALCKALEDFEFNWEGKSFPLGVSIGLVLITATSESVAMILRAADSACYIAKGLGGNRVHLYHEDNNQRQLELPVNDN